MSDIVGYAIEYEVTFDTVPRCGKVQEEITTTKKSTIYQDKEYAMSSLPSEGYVWKKVKFLRLLKVVEALGD